MGYTPHVLVVGGGPVGAGITRDLAIRGLDVTLADSGPLASGSVGRMERLLASGAQFAREDPRYARRCLAENRTLFEIASHCVEDTAGLVVAEDLDDVAAACEECDIPAKVLTAEEVREREPALADDVEGALEVPDATIDPNRLTVSLVRDAHEYGADIRPSTTVTDITVEDGVVQSVTLRRDPRPQSLRGDDAGVDEKSETGNDEEGTGGAVDGAESENGRTAGENGETGSESGETESENGETGSESGETESEGGETGSESGETESEGGETGEAEAGDPQTDGGVREIPGMSQGKTRERPGGNKTGQTPEPSVETLDVDYVINVAGGEADEVAALAGCSLPVSQSRVPRLAVTDLPVETAISRPSGGRADIVAPCGGNVWFEPGSETASTTEGLGGESESDHERAANPPQPSPSAVDALTGAFEDLLPMDSGQVLRASSTVRYDVEPGRGRDVAVLDHDRHHDCWGLLTVLGGTVTTHRWIAERICDRVCEEFGIRRECKTGDLVIHGSEAVPDLAEAVGTFGLDEDVYAASKRRLGSTTTAVLHTTGHNPVLCECQSVTRAEVESALVDETAAPVDLGGVRVRTHATTGRCQGARCAHRLATQLHPAYTTAVVDGATADLLSERWAGQRSVVDRRAEEMASAYRLHAGVMNRTHEPPELTPAALDSFDSGREHEEPTITCCPRSNAGWER